MCCYIRFFFGIIHFEFFIITIFLLSKTAQLCLPQFIPVKMVMNFRWNRQKQKRIIIHFSSPIDKILINEFDHDSWSLTTDIIEWSVNELYSTNLIFFDCVSKSPKILCCISVCMDKSKKNWLVISSSHKEKNQKPISRKIFVPLEYFFSSFTQIHCISFFLWPSVQARNTVSRVGPNIYWCTSQFFPKGVILQTFACNTFKESFACYSTSIDIIRFESLIWWAMFHILIFLATATFIIIHRLIKVEILQYSPRKGKSNNFKTLPLACHMEQRLFKNARTSKRVHRANFIRALN